MRTSYDIKKSNLSILHHKVSWKEFHKYNAKKIKKIYLPSRKDITLATTASRRTIDANGFDCKNNRPKSNGFQTSMDHFNIHSYNPHAKC